MVGRGQSVDAVRLEKLGHPVHCPLAVVLRLVIETDADKPHITGCRYIAAGQDRLLLKHFLCLFLGELNIKKV